MSADSDPARQALFAKLVESNLSVRLVFRVHERIAGTRAAAILVGGFGLVTFGAIAPVGRRAKVLAVARHANARRQVERVSGWVGPGECALLGGRNGLLAAFAAVLALTTVVREKRVGRLLRILRRIDARHGFLVASRVAASMAWYARALDMLRRHRPGVVMVSSDSNPEEAGFLGAAQALGIPRVFIAHAYPTYLSPPLDFTLSILEGEAAVRARLAKGPITGGVLLAGVEGESAPMDAARFERPNPVIGIFTSKAIAWPTLVATIRDCRQHLRASRIIIRWHPSMLERPRLSQFLDDLTGIDETPGSAPLADVARRCDWVIADENSNVHLPVLKLGIPTVAVGHLGVYPESRADQYGFVANQVIPPRLDSVRHFDAAALAAFFSGSWTGRFVQYDAAYLRPPGEVAHDVRQAIQQLVAVT